MSHYEPSITQKACAHSMNSQQGDDEQKQDDDVVASIKASMKNDYKDAVVRLERMHSEYDSKLQQWVDEEREVTRNVLQEIKAYYAGAKWALQQDREQCTKNLELEVAFWKRKLQLLDGRE